METFYYFAYGSNLNLNALPARDIHYTLVEKAVLKNWKLVFDVMEPDEPGFGYASIIPEDGHEVQGALFLLKDKATVRALDKYEVVPIYYLKEEVEVIKQDGSIQKCFTYIANPFNTTVNLKPSKSYLEEILAGKDFFDDDYYNFIKNIETL